MACLSSRLRPETALTLVVAWALLILKLALQSQQFVWYHSWEWAAVNLELTNILRNILCLIDLSDFYSLLAGLLPGFLSVLKGCLVSINGLNPRLPIFTDCLVLILGPYPHLQLIMMMGKSRSLPSSLMARAGLGPYAPGLCYTGLVFYTGTSSCHALVDPLVTIWTFLPLYLDQSDHLLSIGINIEVMRAGNRSRRSNIRTSLS